jgi:hypothetical protein
MKIKPETMDDMFRVFMECADLGEQESGHHSTEEEKSGLRVAFYAGARSLDLLQAVLVNRKDISAEETWEGLEALAQEIKVESMLITNELGG